MIPKRRAIAAAAFSLAALATLCAPQRADAAAPRAAFAVVIGSNASVDSDLAPLRYADDDAAKYFELFRLLGMKTFVLSRFDDNTRRLHPQAAAEALLPRRAEFERVTMKLAEEIAQAKERGVVPVLYFVFAGHGNSANGRGYITLEDRRLSGKDLGDEIVSRIGAAEVHMIIDACHSFQLAYARGPGGSRRAIDEYRASNSELYELAKDPRVGLLLSTSSATDSHEWDAFESGVFSHEVRSGLYGAADANGDRVVSYREIAAFVARANQAIPNERFRPQVHARAPSRSEELVDLRRAQKNALTVDAKHAGRYFIEDGRGVRIADFNTTSDHETRIVRPPPTSNVYVRRTIDNREFLIPPSEEPVLLAQYEPNEPRAQTRGALHESFGLLFSLPFDQSVVDAYRPDVVDAPMRDRVQSTQPSERSLRPLVGWSALGLAAASAGSGIFFTLRASSEANAGDAAQIEIARRNDRIADFNRVSIASFIGAGVFGAAGAALLLWPTSPSAPQKTQISLWPSGTGAVFVTPF